MRDKKGQKKAPPPKGKKEAKPRSRKKKKTLKGEEETSDNSTADASAKNTKYNQYAALSVKENLPKLQKKRHKVNLHVPKIIVDLLVLRERQKARPITQTITVARPVGEMETLPVLPPLISCPKQTPSGSVISYTSLRNVELEPDELSVDLIVKKGGLSFVYGEEKPEARPETIPLPRQSLLTSEACRCEAEACQAQEHALRAWQAHVDETMKQTSHLTDTLQRSTEEMIMSDSNVYRRWVRNYEKVSISNVLRKHYMTRDTKGSRLQQNLMKYRMIIGDELKGLDFNPRRPDIPKRVEHVAIPDGIAIEKGTPLDALKPAPWHPRCKRPDFASLFVTGHSHSYLNNLKYLGVPEPSLQSQPVSQRQSIKLWIPDFGPCLLVNNNRYLWSSVKEDSPQVTQVCLIGYYGDMVRQEITLMNGGCTTIKFYWEKVKHREDSFGLGHYKVRRFYMFCRNKCLSPGEYLQVPVLFRSPDPGVYYEEWFLRTSPAMCGGADIVVHVWGIARVKDVNEPVREEISYKIKHNQTMSMVRRILDSILYCITWCPPKPKFEEKEETEPVLRLTGVDARFEENNKGFHYHSKWFNLAKQVSYQAQQVSLNKNVDVPIISTSQMTSDLKISSARQCLDNLSSVSEDMKESLTWKFSRAVSIMSFTVQRPLECNMKYKTCYDMLCMLVDDMVSIATYMKQIQTKEEAEMSLKVDTNAAKVVKKKRQLHHNKSDPIPVQRRRATSSKGKKRKGVKEPEIKSEVQNCYFHKLYAMVYESLGNMVNKLQKCLDSLRGNDIPLYDEISKDFRIRAMFDARKAKNWSCT